MAAGPAELQALSRLLDEALALAPGERSGWLDSLTGSDAGHRHTLTQLLADAEAPDDPFLTRPELGRLRRVGPGHPEQAGPLVGPSRLLRPNASAAECA